MLEAWLPEQSNGPIYEWGLDGIRILQHSRAEAAPAHSCAADGFRSEQAIRSFQSKEPLINSLRCYCCVKNPLKMRIYGL